jgi:acid phosphatase
MWLIATLGLALVGIVLPAQRSGATSPIAVHRATTPTKVVLIVFENHDYTNIVGNSEAPYFNALIGKGKLFRKYYAVAPGSNKDYLAMTSGRTTETTPASANIFERMQTAGGWRELDESMGTHCGGRTSRKVPGTTVPLYTTDHDPAFMLESDENCASDDVALTSSTQLKALPAFSVIIPNDCDDMHTFPTTGSCPSYFGAVRASSAIAIGDTWLAHVVPLLLAEHSITVVITFDEGQTSAERVYALEVGAGIKAGTTSSTIYNHYGLLAGLYVHFGLGTAPNNAATAAAVPIG